MKILFWDIDGTILRTGKAGLIAFKEAAEKMWNRPVSFANIQAAGMTDYHIAREIIRASCGREPSRPEVITLIKRYEEVLPGQLTVNQGRLMPLIPEILAHFDAHPDYVSLLLTGNSRTGAKAKLACYGVADYFDFDLSAFGELSPDRYDIALKALSLARTAYPGISAEEIYIIGDTPNDIRCGKLIGARTIAVATGAYPLEELVRHSPWWAVETLPPPAVLEAKLAQA